MRVRVLVFLMAACPAAAQQAGSEEWARGSQFYMSEDYAAASEAFESAAGKDPSNAAYQYWLGLTKGRQAQGMSGLRRLAAMGLARQVRQHFEKALELDGTYLDALVALQDFHIQAPGVVGGSQATAAELAARIESIDRARGAVAWAMYQESRRDWELAAEKHSLAREIAPDDLGILLGQASFLSRRGMHSASDSLFDAAFDRHPDNPEVWLSAAKSWVRAKRKTKLSQARELLERYLASPERDPASASPLEVRRLLKQL